MKKLINKYQIGRWFPIGYDNTIYRPTYGTLLPEVRVVAKGDPRKVNNDYYKAHSRARANVQQAVQEWDDRDRLVLNTMLGVGAAPVIAAHPLSFILGIAGGEGVNTGIRGISKGRYNDFGEWSSNLITGDNSIAPLTSWLNPGYALAGANRSIVRGVPVIADKYFFVKHPNSFTRGIGGKTGFQDLIESGLIRGNPVGTEISPKSFRKGYKHDRNKFRTIMDATNRKGIAQRFYNRTLSREDFEAIKKASKPYVEEYEALPKEEENIFSLRDSSPDPLDAYVNYDDYIATLADDKRTLKNATSFDESGQPLAYFYDDGRNPLTQGHSYAASKYGVRINNADAYSPRIFEGHLHYSMPKAVPLSDPNVEVFRRGPFGLTLKMNKNKLLKT